MCVSIFSTTFVGNISHSKTGSRLLALVLVLVLALVLALVLMLGLMLLLTCKGCLHCSSVIVRLALERIGARGPVHIRTSHDREPEHEQPGPSLRRIQQDIVINVKTSLCEVPVIFVGF